MNARTPTLLLRQSLHVSVSVNMCEGSFKTDHQHEYSKNMHEACACECVRVSVCVIS